MATAAANGSALWRLNAFLHVVYAHHPSPKDFINNIISQKILPWSLERLRRNTAAFLQDSPNERDMVASFLGKESLFEISVLSPVSFEDFDDCFEEILPINASGALRRAFRLAATTLDEQGKSNNGQPSSIAHGTTSLAAQFLIEGVDCWMNDEKEVTKEERQRFVRACGVSPAAIDEGLQLNPYVLSDFVIDLVFPEGSRWWSGAPPMDWLASVYTSGVKTIGDSASAKFFWDNRTKRGQQSGSAEVNATPIKSRQKEQKSVGKRAPTTVSNKDSTPEATKSSKPSTTASNDDELVISEDNIHELLAKTPHLLPKDVLVARRKSILDASISAFEVEHHFTIAELKAEVAAIVKEISRRQQGSKPSGSSIKKDDRSATDLLVDDKDNWKGKKADIANRFVQSILPAIRRQFAALPPEVVDVDAASSPDGASTTPSPRAVDVDVLSANTVEGLLEQLSKSTPKLITKQLVDTFSRTQLNDYLMTTHSAGSQSRPNRLTLDEVMKLKTKLDCAKVIVSTLSK